MEELLSRWSDKLIGAASGVSTGIGFVFNVATIATFTFYFAADFPGSCEDSFPGSARSTSSLGWAIDQSITQVGGYLYSGCCSRRSTGSGSSS